MDATIASQAIQGILNACDNKTKQSILKHISSQQTTLNTLKRKPLVTLLEAKENLINKHFKH